MILIIVKSNNIFSEIAWQFCPIIQYRAFAEDNNLKYGVSILTVGGPLGLTDFDCNGSSSESELISDISSTGAVI